MFIIAFIYTALEFYNQCSVRNSDFIFLRMGKVVWYNADAAAIGALYTQGLEL